MITLKFLGTWVKLTALAALALLLEYVFVHGVGWYLTAVLVTVLAYAGITAALWREWRFARQYIHYSHD